MNITNLPELCLLRIFYYVPTADLIELPQVYPSWQSLMMSIANKRNKLTIAIGPSAVSLISNSVFTIPYLDEIVDDESGKCIFLLQNHSQFWLFELDSIDDATALKIVDLFPNVHQLEVSIRNVNISQVDQIVLMFKKWKLNLKLLKIFAHFDKEKYERKSLMNHLFDLIDSINLLTHLKHLTLDINNSLVDYYLPDFPRYSKTIKLLNLSQLNQLYFSCPSEFNSALCYVVEPNINESTQIQQIGITNVFNYIVLMKYSNLLPKFTTMTNFQLHSTIQIDNLTNLFNQCTSLRSLTVDMPELNMNKLVEHLSPLSGNERLIHFCIRFQQVNYESQPQQQITQLTSVKVFTFKLLNQSHSSTRSPVWAQMFPNVQVIKIVHQFECVDCGIKDCPEGWEKREQCLRALLGPLKKFPKLRTVYTCYEDDLVNIRKLSVQDL